MRVVAGDWRGRTLAPVGAGAPTARLRPTSDRVRESMFDVLLGGRFGDPVTGARVLDLFAGTGALGLEALSRGASEAVFVDEGAKALALARENIRRCRADGRAQLFRRDATKLGRRRGPAFDLVFLDPPYGEGLGRRALASALEGGWLARPALAVWEDGSPQAAPEGFALLDLRRYGDTHVAFLETPADDRDAA